jgi:hypothetical protein
MLHMYRTHASFCSPWGNISWHGQMRACLGVEKEEWDVQSVGCAPSSSGGCFKDKVNAVEITKTSLKIMKITQVIHSFIHTFIHL